MVKDDEECLVKIREFVEELPLNGRLEACEPPAGMRAAPKDAGAPKSGAPLENIYDDRRSSPALQHARVAELRHEKDTWMSFKRITRKRSSPPCEHYVGSRWA